MLADLAAAAPPPPLAGLGVVRVRPPVLRREDLRLRWLLLEDPRHAVVVHLDDQLTAVASASADADEERGRLTVHLDLHAAPPAPRFPAGIRVRTFRPGADEQVLWEVNQRAFADVAIHLPIGPDDLLRDRDPAADPELVLLAEHVEPRSAGEVVGVLIGQAGTEVAASDAWVRDLAVLPAWRRRGIAMALLRTGFAAFRTRGLTGVALEVDDVTLGGALALYRRAGMRITRRTDVLEWSS